MRRFVLSLCVVFGLGTIGVPLGAQSTTSPPQPSYEDEWVATEVKSSPFLNLRNDEGPDTPEAPSLPDTPTLETVRDTEPGEEESRKKDGKKKSDGEQETREAASEKKDEPTEPADQKQTPGPSAKKESEAEKPDESTEEARGGSKQKTPAEQKEPPAPSPDELAGDILREATPVDTDGITFAFDPTGGTVTLHEIPLTMPPLTTELSRPTSPQGGPPGWWQFWGYRYWGFGGLVVLIITGIFFWFSPARITVLERNHPSTEEFFQGEEPEGSSEQSEFGDSAEVRTRDPDRGVEGPDVETAPSSESLMNILAEHGIEDEHQELVERYFEEGLSRREVARQSALGEGEVGLVLDLADRIKEDVAHAEGA